MFTDHLHLNYFLFPFFFLLFKLVILQYSTSPKEIGDRSCNLLFLPILYLTIINLVNSKNIGFFSSRQFYSIFFSHVTYYCYCFQLKAEFFLYIFVTEDPNHICPLHICPPGPKYHQVIWLKFPTCLSEALKLEELIVAFVFYSPSNQTQNCTYRKTQCIFTQKLRQCQTKQKHYFLNFVLPFIC